MVSLIPLTGSSASGGSQTRGCTKDRKGSGEERKLSPGLGVPLVGSGSDSSETGSVVKTHVMMPPQKPLPPPPMPGERELPPPPAPLNAVSQDLSGSRQSFRMAMGNPCESLTMIGTKLLNRAKTPSSLNIQSANISYF